MTWTKLVKIWLGLFFLFGLYLAGSFYYQQNSYFSFNFSPRPILKPKNESLLVDLTAQSYLIIDAETGTIVKSRNEDLQLPPASLTKIPAAIVALRKYPLNQVITIKKEYPIGKIMGLKEGEKIDVNSLMHGLLIHSANDAAFVLAGQEDEEREAFIEEMNQIAEKYNLKKTHFVNFDGEEDIGHLSSAFDLAQLTRFALKNPVFKHLVQITEKTVYDQSNNIAYDLETTNELLGEFENVKGVKTGWTPQAGECLISLVYIEERPVLIVVLGSKDRFEDTSKIINWTKQNLVWFQPKDANN